MTSGIDKSTVLDQRARAMPTGDLEKMDSVLVIAPHPDDESLGCGGTIARLRERNIPVHVLFVSDGTMSHPNSPGYPAERLRDLREAEALDALRVLNVPPENATFMRLKDRSVPLPDNPDFPSAAAFVANLLRTLRPATIFAPWRRDPHPDHRASWQLLRTALEHHRARPRVFEYLIWLWELGSETDMPRPDEMIVWRVPIDRVLEQRDRAIAAHRSQVTRLIDDDPAGFYLSPELLTHFKAPRELFLEEKPTL
ncbi:PIG-L deacetylase family protein [Spirosoma montaniterrae]|uniref:GlcNAc-PI de-N-acetylase n=1 Tax=Spirosoma montaniterrae TaxID=1178516 RepID=A0A1P9WVG9_9BACT|nr:PIG-L deacetylase family protein [Spirosoma montaniterrae]AQG79320.1 GlcNAc-PI de-N-acetylase [Spirosoma montaniterrae]